MPEIRWKVLKIAGELTIDYPETALWSLPDEGTTLRIDLDPGPRGTAIFTSRYPRQPAQPGEPLAEFLGRMGREFVDVVLKRQAATRGQFTVTAWEGAQGGLTIAEIVLPIPGGMHWLIRTYGRAGCDDYQLIHWNGDDETTLDVVRTIFDSFEPLLPGP